MSQSGDLGHQAENAVAEYLGCQGYRICARNYQIPRIGELDLVAWKDSQLAVIEVKARKNARAYGGLTATITPGKIRRLQKTAWCYLKEMQLMNTDVSFLAALVQINPQNEIASIEIIPIECL